MTHDKPNMRKLTNGHGYVVRTQAGFKKTIKDWLDDDGDWLSQPAHFNYPKVYPSVVFFYTFYQGQDGYNCSCTPINEYVQCLKDQLEELEDE